MSGLTYETVARVAQQAGTIYFAVIFAVAIGWALLPRNKPAFDDAAQIPFRERPPGGTSLADDTTPDVSKGEH